MLASLRQRQCYVGFVLYTVTIETSTLRPPQVSRLYSTTLQSSFLSITDPPKKGIKIEREAGGPAPKKKTFFLLSFHTSCSALTLNTCNNIKAFSHRLLFAEK